MLVETTPLRTLLDILQLKVINSSPGGFVTRRPFLCVSLASERLREASRDENSGVSGPVGLLLTGSSRVACSVLCFT